MIDIGVAATDDEKEAIYRFRYDVYVEEMGRYCSIADHAGRRLVEPEDAHSWIFYARDGADVVGTTRVTWGGHGISERQVHCYALKPFLAEIPLERLAVGERGMVATDRRGTDLYPRLMAGSDDILAEHDVRAVFGACEPHLVPMYLDYQRPYGDRNISNPDAGYLIPMVAFMQGVEALAEFGVGGTLPPSIEAVMAGSGTIACPFLQGTAEYVTAVTSALSRLDGSLFDGFTDDELARCLERSIVVNCANGDRVLKRGGTARNFFVVLNGALEVSDGGSLVGVVHPGEVVGEMAYLLRQPRRYDVDALSDGTQLLSLSERSMRDLTAAAPSLAAKLLTNLAALLCRRLSHTDRRVSCSR